MSCLGVVPESKSLSEFLIALRIEYSAMKYGTKMSNEPPLGPTYCTGAYWGDCIRIPCHALDRVEQIFRDMGRAICCSYTLILSVRSVHLGSAQAGVDLLKRRFWLSPDS